MINDIQKYIQDVFGDTELPKVKGFNILAMPYRPEEKTSGGIILTETARDNDVYDNRVALVLSVSDLAYKDSDRFKRGPWCSVGDWILYPRHEGCRFKFAKQDLIILQEELVLAVVGSPKELSSF